MHLQYNVSRIASVKLIPMACQFECHNLPYKLEINGKCPVSLRYGISNAYD